MIMLAWLLTVIPLDPVANHIVPNPPLAFVSEEDCHAAREAIIKNNMYKNWQGLTMAPLISTYCKKVEE